MTSILCPDSLDEFRQQVADWTLEAMKEYHVRAANGEVVSLEVHVDISRFRERLTLDERGNLFLEFHRYLPPSFDGWHLEISQGDVMIFRISTTP